MELNIDIDVNGIHRSVIQTGTVVAVSSPPFEDYYLHVKFHHVLDSVLIREFAIAAQARKS